MVVLLDRDGLWDQPYEPSPAWDKIFSLGWAWMALSDVDKYLRRGLHLGGADRAREGTFVAATSSRRSEGMKDPEYRVTSLLDYGGRLPEGFESTLAGLDAAEIRRAAFACAELLAAYLQRPFAASS